MSKQITITLHETSAELPERSTEVLTFSVNANGAVYSIGSVRYSAKHKSFCCGDESPEETVEQRRKTWADVQFWAYTDEIKKKIARISAT